MKVIHLVICCVSLVLSASTGAALAEADFPLTGNYTQNVPCKGDGSDPTKLKVEISAQGINSKVGVCAFLDIERGINSISAHVECTFPAGPLIGDVTFAIQPNNTIKFFDRDQHYRSVLYRCPP